MTRLTPERVRELLAGDLRRTAMVSRAMGVGRIAEDLAMGVGRIAEDLAADALALHDALARVTRERDAAVAARDALAGAVHVVRVAFAATTASGAQYGAAWDAVDAMPPTAVQSEGIAAALRTSYEAQETLEGALTALLDGAPADVVRGDVVRAYLAAADALPGDLATINAAIDKERAARAALDAALLAAKGAP